MGTRVLVVEPDARLREAKEARLRAAGYLVIGVGDVELAQAALEVSPYPLVVLMDRDEPDDRPDALFAPLDGPVDGTFYEAY